MTTHITYIGTKIVQARLVFDHPGSPRHLDTPPGYEVVYEDGYTSWSPKDVFEKAYRKTDAMTFGDALVMLKAGKKVARAGWNGKGMFLFLVAGSTFQVSRPPLLGIYPEGHTVNYHAHIDMKTADDKVVPWLASQTDMLAEDWCTVE